MKFEEELQALMTKYGVHLVHEEIPHESHGEWSTYDSYKFVGPDVYVNVVDIAE